MFARVAALLAVSAACYGQQEVPTFRTGTTLIEFTVSALDSKGKPVTDLKKEIQITGQGQPRSLAFFRFEGEIVQGRPQPPSAPYLLESHRVHSRNAAQCHRDPAGRAEYAGAGSSVGAGSGAGIRADTRPRQSRRSLLAGAAYQFLAESGERMIADAQIAIGDRASGGAFVFRVDTVQLELAGDRARHAHSWEIAPGTSTVRAILGDRSTRRFGTLDLAVQ